MQKIFGKKFLKNNFRIFPIILSHNEPEEILLARLQMILKVDLRVPFGAYT